MYKRQSGKNVDLAGDELPAEPGFRFGAGFPLLRLSLIHILPKYPAILRDISLVVDEDMAVGDIQKVIMAAGGDLLKSADLFDIYRGPQVGEGKKSVAFALVYSCLLYTSENDMYFVRVEISEAGVKAYVLENLMCQGTPQDITSSMDAGYLQEAVRELFSRGIERGTLKVSGDEYISFSPEID